MNLMMACRAAYIPLGVLAGMVSAFLAVRRQGNTGRKAAEIVLLFALFAVPLCLIGARLLNCLLDSMNLYRLAEEPTLVFDPYFGGFALYGGMLGYLMACALAAKVKGLRFLSLMDALSPAGLIVIAFVRLYEGFSGHGYSFDVENPAFCFFPLSIYDPDWEVWYLALFMLEALYALAAAAVLLRRRPSAPGGNFCRGLLLYAGMQIWFESLRRDNYLRAVSGFVRIMQVISMLIVTGILIAVLLRPAARPDRRAAAAAAHVLLLGGVVFFEFAVEYKIGFLEHFSKRVLTQAGHYWFCYGCMLLLVLAIMVNVFLSWRAAREAEHTA